MSFFKKLGNVVGKVASVVGSVAKVIPVIGPIAGGILQKGGELLTKATSVTKALGSATAPTNQISASSLGGATASYASNSPGAVESPSGNIFAKYWWAFLGGFIALVTLLFFIFKKPSRR